MTTRLFVIVLFSLFGSLGTGNFSVAQPKGKVSFKGDKVALELGEPYASFAVGGSGRYFIFHLPKRSVLAIVDVVKGKVVHEIPDVRDDVLVAAGAKKMVLVMPSQRMIQRWSLGKKFQREKVALLTSKGTPRAALMGSNSDGPLLLAADDALLIDLKTLKPMEIEGKVVGAAGRYGISLRISADGQTVGSIPTGYGPVAYSLMRIRGNRTTVQQFDSTSYAHRHALPSADGSLIFLLGPKVYSGSLMPISVNHLKGCTLYPTVDPAYFLAVRFAVNADKKHVTHAHICTTADRRIVHTIVGLEEMAPHGNTNSRTSVEWALHQGLPQFHYIPWANVFATLAWDKKSVVLRRFDLQKTLANSEIDHLFVDSVPPTELVAGEKLEYQVSVRSKAGKVKFGLEEAPKGMTISKEGKITWQVPAEGKEKTASAIVHIRDGAKEEIFHTFEIAIRKE